MVYQTEVTILFLEQVDMENVISIKNIELENSNMMLKRTISQVQALTDLLQTLVNTMETYII